jgi:hypothetical protein
MCDYSLENHESRAARTGDRLITTSFANFPNAPTRGFCAPEAPEVAVCLLPGTELGFEQPVRNRGIWGLLLQLWEFQSFMARFRQINLDKAYRHHDALELENGRITLLNDLRVGQVATVLQLPVAAIHKTAARNAETAVPELVE